MARYASRRRSAGVPRVWCEGYVEGPVGCTSFLFLLACLYPILPPLPPPRTLYFPFPLPAPYFLSHSIFYPSSFSLHSLPSLLSSSSSFPPYTPSSSALSSTLTSCLLLFLLLPHFRSTLSYSLCIFPPSVSTLPRILNPPSCFRTLSSFL